VRFVRRNRLVVILSTVVLMVLPQIVQPWWSMFRSDPMFPTLYTWLNGLGVSLPPHFTLPWPMLFTVPLGLAILALVLRDMLGSKARLEIRFGQRPPYIIEGAGVTQYRVGIYNRGPAMTTNAALHLLDLSPTPKAPGMFRGDFPYRVTRAVAKYLLDLEPCQINPEQEELFEVAQSWVTGQPDNRLMVNRIDTKWPLDKLDGYIGIERDEEWRCDYRVSIANGDAIDFSLVMAPRGDTLSVDLVPLARARSLRHTVAR
jgi:hypothetical protein